MTMAIPTEYAPLVLRSSLTKSLNQCFCFSPVPAHELRFSGPNSFRNIVLKNFTYSADFSIFTAEAFHQLIFTVMALVSTVFNLENIVHIVTKVAKNILVHFQNGRTSFQQQIKCLSRNILPPCRLLMSTKET